MGSPNLERVSDALGAILAAVCMAWVLGVPFHLGAAFYTEQFLAVVLGLALATSFCTYSAQGRRTDARIPWFDVLFATTGLAIGLYIAFNYPRLIIDVTAKTPETIVLGGILLALVLEALRRCTGWTLLAVVVFFLGYAMFADLAPQELRGRQIMPGSLVVYLAFDPNAMFGVPIAIGATVIIMFLWMEKR